MRGGSNSGEGWVKYWMYIYREKENRCYLVEDEYDRFESFCKKLEIMIKRLKQGERIVVEIY